MLPICIDTSCKFLSSLHDTVIQKVVLLTITNDEIQIIVDLYCIVVLTFFELSLYCGKIHWPFNFSVVIWSVTRAYRLSK